MRSFEHGAIKKEEGAKGVWQRDTRNAATVELRPTLAGQRQDAPETAVFPARPSRWDGVCGERG